MVMYDLKQYVAWAEVEISSSVVLSVQVSPAVWKNICRRWEKNKCTTVNVPPSPAFTYSIAWDSSGKRFHTLENGSGLS